MSKYFILRKTKGKADLVDTVEADSVVEAQKIAVRKHMSLALSTTSQMVVVGKSGYDKYYKEESK